MMGQAARALVRRDLQLLWARRGDALQPALFALLTALLWVMHRANIARLMNGTEGRIGKTAASET